MSQRFLLVTIIVPVYNVESYIEKCLESIVNQTYKNLEIIIVDDGSTDCSGRECDRMASVDDRIKVYHTPNGGLVAARKLGLQKAKGQYIGFVDGDDYIEKDMYEKLLEQVLEEESDFIHSTYVKETEGECSIVGRGFNQVKEFSKEADKIDFIQKHVLDTTSKEMVTPSIWSKLFKAEFIKKCYSFVPDEQQYGEDWICLIVSVMEANRISLTNDAYYHYIVREGSISHVKNEKYVFNEIHLYHYLLKCISNYRNNEVEILMYEFLRHRLMDLVEYTASPQLSIPRFYWGNMLLLKGKKIILYGAGRVGKDYYAQMCKYKWCEIVSWVDSSAEKILCDYANICSLKEIERDSFDYILVAINDEEMARAICLELEAGGICKDKIIWDKPLTY